jgi:hypothetical protein
MKINTEKTEVMIKAKQELKARVFVQNRELNQTTYFKYLGSVIASNSKIQAEMLNSCSKATQFLGQLTPILRNKHITLDTQRALYNNCPSYFVLPMSNMVTNSHRKYRNR